MKYFLDCTILLAMILISGCKAGPDFKRPEKPGVKEYTSKPLPEKTTATNVQNGEAQHFVENLDLSGEWWKLFESKELNSLIAKSIKNNPNLKAAEASLIAAQENMKAQRGFFFPSISANYNASRQKIPNSISASNPLPSGASPFSLYTGQLNISYSPDVFGLNGRQVEALKSQVDLWHYQLAAAYVTLTSNIAVAAIGEAAISEQIVATNELIKINTNMLKMLRKQLASGVASGIDIATLESQLAQIKATLPPLQKQLLQQRDLLTALAGHFSSEEVSETFKLSDLHLPKNLPLSLPSKLVEQRPDVASAQEQLHFASAKVGIATANRLPQFNITAGIGYSGTSSSGNLFKPDNYFWNLVGGITQPIFNGGTLLHIQKAAKAEYDQALYQYQSTLVGAFQNVADTLYAIEQDANLLNAVATAKNSASTTLELTKHQFQLGSASYLAVLNAEQTYQQARINLIQAEANRLIDTVALFQALGGGWWNIMRPS